MVGGDGGVVGARETNSPCKATGIQDSELSGQMTYKKEVSGVVLCLPLLQRAGYYLAWPFRLTWKRGKSLPV